MDSSTAASCCHLVLLQNMSEQGLSTVFLFLFFNYRRSKKVTRAEKKQYNFHFDLFPKGLFFEIQ
jgi:hypothetical protein